MRRPDITTLASTVITVVLGGIGGAAGFTHTHDWAATHGQHGWLAWADAVVIEGMAVVAGFEIHQDRAAGRTGRAALLPQVVLVVAFLVQMTAQVARAEPTPAGWLLAAMPALGFLTVVKLAMRHHHPPHRGHDNDDVERAVPDPIPGPTPLPAVPASASMLSKLPASVRTGLADVTHRAHSQGRHVTADDIRAVINLPDSMITNIIDELNLKWALVE